MATLESARMPNLRDKQLAEEAERLAEAEKVEKAAKAKKKKNDK